MARQRFAVQRKLAELPQFPVTEETAAKLAYALDRINRGTYGGVDETTLGPVLETKRGPVRMQLTLGDEGFFSLSPEDIRDLDRREVGQMGPTGLQDAVADAHKVRSVSFSMIDPDGYPIFGYTPIQDPDVKRQIQAAGGYTKPMLEALYKLIENNEMQPGDILSATPLGLRGGDVRRALTYMNQGFGAPDRMSNQMYAQIGRDGKLQPVQLLSPNNQVARMIGARQDLSRLLQPRQLEMDLNPRSSTSISDIQFSESDLSEAMGIDIDAALQELRISQGMADRGRPYDEDEIPF